MCSQGAEPCHYITGRLSCSVNLRTGTLEVGTAAQSDPSLNNVGLNIRLPGGVNYNNIH